MGALLAFPRKGVDYSNLTRSIGVQSWAVAPAANENVPLLQRIYIPEADMLWERRVDAFFASLGCAVRAAIRALDDLWLRRTGPKTLPPLPTVAVVQREWRPSLKS